MRITVDVPDMYVEMLAKWASVSRTLKASHRLLHEFLSTVELVSDGTTDEVTTNCDELRDITPALDALHQVVRSALWVERRRLETMDKKPSPDESQATPRPRVQGKFISTKKPRR